MTQSPAQKPRASVAVRVLWGVGIAIVAIVALGVGLTSLSASPRVCAICHEMQPAVARWQQSAHGNIACPSCHETTRPWYQFPVTLAERAKLLQRDYAAHQAAAKNGTPIAFALQPIPDSRCLDCHDLSRTITLKYGTLINHADHAKRNRSCISCHLSTGHPDPNAQRQLLLMRRCFTCHSRTPGAKAPGTCATCHPKSFSQRPDTHAAATWATTHGKTATADRTLCTMCHEPTFCIACHGVEMPHPSWWLKGKQGHSLVGKRDPQLCQKCHVGNANLCSMCHHKSYSSSDRPWVELHPAMVTRKGAAFCMTCHHDVFCYDCHTRRRIGGANGP